MYLRFLIGAAACLLGSVAHADTYYWCAPIDGSTNGTITTPHATIGVRYTGPGRIGKLPWLPATTYADGKIVENAPANGHVIRLTGGDGAVNTITFSEPVTNPVMSIVSLGGLGINASFTFIDATPIPVVGGRNPYWGGGPLTVSGNTVSGDEANATVRFLGVYTSISWTNPTYENWFGFDVGVPETGEPVS